MARTNTTLFPTAKIDTIRSIPTDRTLKDEFESGGHSSRALWPSRYFRRRFSVKTTVLTQLEFRTLRAFWAEHGTNTPFIFRNNIDRTGNTSVRFLNFPHDLDTHAVASFDLEESEPIRERPTLEEIHDAAGTRPLLWFDPNAERYLWDAYDQLAATETTVFDQVSYTGKLAWQTGALNFQDTEAQNQAYLLNYLRWAKTATNIGITGGQPACTIIAIAQTGALVSQKQVIIAIGDMGATKAMGLAVAADNKFEPWMGGTETFANTRIANSPVWTWRSLAAVWPSGSTNISTYSNGTLVGTDTRARAYANSVGSVSLGAALDGTLQCGPINEAPVYLGQALVFNAALTATQIKSVHNLFAYQFDLSTV